MPIIAICSSCFHHVDIYQLNLSETSVDSYQKMSCPNCKKTEFKLWRKQ